MKLAGIRTVPFILVYFAAGLAFATGAFGQSGGQVLYNGIVLPQQWPPSQTLRQDYQIPSYITNPPAVIPIDTGRQLFVDDFLIQQTTMARTQHRPVMYPANPIIVPGPLDLGLNAMPFSGGAWFDPADRLFKMWLFCGSDPAKVCYAYSIDGKTWIRPAIQDAFIPNTDEVNQNGSTLWMDLHETNPARKFKLFTWNVQKTGVEYSPDGIHWTGTNLQWPLVYDRSTVFWNPFRNVWVGSMKNDNVLPTTPKRLQYFSRARNYSESSDLVTWTPAEPSNFTTSFWTGPDDNDPPYYPGGTFPQLYNLDAVGYESVMVGLFSWFYGGFDDDNPAGLPGPDVVELGVGFSRDGFQWVRPTRGAGPGPNGAFIPASNIPGTWNMGNTQSAAGCFLVVGDELWFYFSGRDGLHDTPWPNVLGSTGLATMRRDGFYSMDAGSTPRVLTTRPVKFSGKHLFVNVKNPQGSLQIQVLNPGNGAVLATSLPLTTDKTLQQVAWGSGLTDLSALAGQPVQFQFTLTSGELYSFWVAASQTGASNGYVAAGGPGFTTPIDDVGVGAYASALAAPEIYPLSAFVSGSTAITILARTLGSTIYYTVDGTTPTASSILYSGPFNLPSSATVKAMAVAPGFDNSPVASKDFIGDNTPPTVFLTAPGPGQTLFAGTALTASASDGISGVASVQFLVDGVPLGTVASAPYTITLQTTTLTNSTHQITAIATDRVGLQTTSAPVTIAIQNVSSGPTTGLAGYWSFDSLYKNGAIFYDQSGRNNNGVAVAAIPALGPAAQATQFNGFTSYVQVASSPSTTPYDLTGDLSLSLWVQTVNSSRTEVLVSKYAASGSGSGYVLRTTPSGFAELLLGPGNVSSGATVGTDVTRIDDGAWHQLTVVIHMGTSAEFYVDGALSSAQILHSIPGAANPAFNIGAAPTAALGSYFTGSLDEVRIYNRALSATEILSLSGAVAPTPPAAAGLFLRSDTVTQGNWKGKYGLDGSLIANDSSHPPSYATVNVYGNLLYTWAGSTTASRALLKGASPTDRIASTYYASTGFTIDINLTDGQSHQVALYLLDWDPAQRSETISVVRAGTGAVLDTRSAANFVNGQYLVWNLSGHVLINVLQSGPLNAVVSGIFFQQAGGPDLVITKTHVGVFAPGDQGDTYTLTATNAGGAATSGAVTVTDSLPSSMAAAAISGNGWNCTQPGGPCTRSDVLNSGASYPAITLSVNVGNITPTTLINSASVSGGSEVDTTNDTAQDPTSIQNQSASSFLTGYALNGPLLRNNFGGWVGMKITVGPNPVTVFSLGRLCTAGNSGTHVVKFVSVASGADVPGGSASLNLSGCSAGQFFYAGLGGAIVLQANTAYYLVSQEVNGGDKWYDYGTLSSTGVAAVNSSVWLNGTTWTPISGPNSSYVPPNFLYGPAAGTIPVTVQTSPAGLSFSVDGANYTSTQVLNWAPGSTHTIATATQSGGSGTQYSWTAWSDLGALSHIVTPGSAITYTANFTTQYLLTTGVTPAGSGSVTANPASASGYYDSATPVQLTAAPAGSNTFTAWSGDVSGSANPQNVTMSAPRSVTGNFQLPAGSSTSFLTGFALNSPPQRNDFGGWVGMKLTVGAAPLSVTALGRIFLTGNSGTHTVKLVRVSDGVDVPGGSVSIPMAGGTAGQFQYALLSSSLTLAANTAYYLVSQETAGGDKWYDHGALTATGVASVNSSVWLNGTVWSPLDGPNTSYVPLNILYGPPVGTIPVTVQTNPAGRSFSVDGTNYTATQILNWIPGSTHTIATTTQSGGIGTQYLWNTWSDAGAISHTVAPSSTITYTANFTTQYLLTTSITPAGSGSVTANPASASGYYDSATPVQLTAAPAGSNSFNGWSGDASGSANPQSVTMSAPRTVTASFQLPAGSSTSFLTGFALNNPALRNNFGGFVGMQLTVGASPLSVSSVGRVCVAGNSQNHLVKFVSVSSGGTDVPGGSAVVNMSSCTPGQSVYTLLASPITLQAGGSYYLVSQENLSGDLWYDHGSIAATNVATVLNSVYFLAGTQNRIDGPNSSYVPPDFQYAVLAPPSPQPLVIDFNLNNRPVRNDFTGFIGMKITVGAAAWNVSSLGRQCLPGNSQIHALKLVSASDGTDVPGGTAAVNMAGCLAGQFVYANLGTPVLLQASTAYYLVSQESSGGDQWYDVGSLTATNIAKASGFVYSTGSPNYISTAGTNLSYGPVNLK